MYIKEKMAGKLDPPDCVKCLRFIISNPQNDSSCKVAPCVCLIKVLSIFLFYWPVYAMAHNLIRDLNIQDTYPQAKTSLIDGCEWDESICNLWVIVQPPALNKHRGTAPQTNAGLGLRAVLDRREEAFSFMAFAWPLGLKAVCFLLVIQ